MSKFGALLLVLVLLIPTAAAATITVTPDAIDPGDTVTVDVQNLPDGAAFSLGIRGEFDVTPGERFAFTARNLVLPFSLGSGEVSAYSRGTEWTGLSVQMPDGASASLSNNADANGEFRTTQTYNISSGTYAVITLDGRAAPTTERVVTEVTMQGTKTGPDNGRISFAIDGITHGTATVTVYVDGREALSRAITVGTPSSGTGGSSSSGPGSSGTVSSTTTAPTSTTGSPTTIAATDGKVSLTGTGIAGAGLLSLSVQGTIPPGWSTSGNAYAVTPEDRQFDPTATLSFQLPSAGAQATIARYEDGIWSAVPSRIEGDRITTAIDRAGSYILLVAAQVPGQTTTVTTATQARTTTAPVATASTAAPLSPFIAAVAFIAAIALVLRKP
ncbi:hypothetical protein [Methanoculleus sp.]|uniref:hypothetical protein n=1 Tax=Methanoculleus sp. TaxID=90427 RepID=UPI001BD574BD|nr:hypothetical protein [Methanoculleus sp.]